MSTPSNNITYDLFPKIDLKRKNIDGKRHYLVEGADAPYVSMTTALGILSKNGIRKWRNRVGAQEANKITRQSASIGTHVHNNVERWLLGDDNWHGDSPLVNQLTGTIVEHLRKNITVVHGIEHRMYSDKLRAAGTSDLIAEYNGQRAIIDFKTSRKIKDEKHITSYYLQGAGYAQMALERHDVIISNIVIIMVSLENELKVFECPVSQWSTKISNFFNHFHAGRLLPAN